MRIYLASRYSRRDELRSIATILRKEGHIVTSRWLETTWGDRPNESSSAPLEYREKYAVIDYEDIISCNMFIAFTEPPGEGSRGGRHVEFGIAIALHKNLIVIGHQENIFYYLPNIAFFETFEQALPWINLP